LKPDYICFPQPRVERNRHIQVKRNQIHQMNKYHTDYRLAE